LPWILCGYLAHEDGKEALVVADFIISLSLVRGGLEIVVGVAILD